MQSGPREIVTPYRPIPLTVPEGMKPNEFFNSARRDRTIVTIFLCNAKRLFGRIKAFDRFTLLLEGHGGEQILFKHASALPPASRTVVLIAGWGPYVVFPFVPLLYFRDWKVSLFAIFLGVFWAGMGRKLAQATIVRQCLTDGAFLKFALGMTNLTLPPVMKVRRQFENDQ